MIVCYFSCGAASAIAVKLAINKYGKENVRVVNNPVAWHEGKFVLNRGCKNYPISGCELMEIIGNIHKNSELPQCEKNL